MTKDEEYQEQQKQANKSMMWIGIASIVMMFAGMTSAYIVLQDDHFWVKTSLPTMFAISSVVIALSSLSMWWALRSAKNDNQGGLRNGLILTLILGIGFSATQYLGWSQLTKEGRFFIGKVSDMTGTYGEDYLIMKSGEPLLHSEGNFYAPGDINYTRPLNERVDNAFNVSTSFLYVISGLHMAHLAGGILALLYTLVFAFRGRYNSENSNGLEVCSIYWHFLDILWIYLYLFFLFIR
jgi:cytochrome c oxidase subunit 3